MPPNRVLPKWNGWRLFRQRRSSGRPRILVVGQHQGAALAQAIANLVPDVDVTILSAVAAARRPRAAARLLAEFDRHDVAFVGSDLPNLRDGGTITDLREHTRVQVAPMITFSAFHPDQVRVGLDGRALVVGPMGSWHSALVLFAFVSGMSQEEAAGLFRGDVYRRVGYFDAWDAAARGLHALGAQTGHDLDGAPARWMNRGGCFMHAVDHLRLHATADLAERLLRRAGISYEMYRLEDYMSGDPGQQSSWPVYPEIAAHYGVTGSALFLRPAPQRHGRKSPTMSLRTFVEESFAAYARAPRQTLKCSQVAVWQRDGELVSILQNNAVKDRLS